MRKHIAFTIALGLALVLLLFGVVPAMANDGGRAKVQAPFTVDPDQPGQLVERGATIHHLINGVTELYGANKALKSRALESEASLISTPQGPRKANRVYYVPNGAEISNEGDITYILDGNTRILTIVDDSPKRVPAINGWIEQVNDWSINSIDYFDAYWTVPLGPPNRSLTNTDYYFNAIEPQDGTSIIQPVIQWNQNQGTNMWQIASWYVWSSGAVVSRALKVNVGDTIHGTMSYSYSGKWTVTSQDGKLKSTLVVSQGRGKGIGYRNLAIFCALEGYSINNNGDLPGDTTFTGMNFRHRGNNLATTVTWSPLIISGTNLTGLEVQLVNPPNAVSLLTPN